MPSAAVQPSLSGPRSRLPQWRPRRKCANLRKTHTKVTPCDVFCRRAPQHSNYAASALPSADDPRPTLRAPISKSTEIRPIAAPDRDGGRSLSIRHSFAPNQSSLSVPAATVSSASSSPCGAGSRLVVQYLKRAHEPLPLGIISGASAARIPLCLDRWWPSADSTSSLPLYIPRRVGRRRHPSIVYRPAVSGPTRKHVRRMPFARVNRRASTRCSCRHRRAPPPVGAERRMSTSVT